MARDILINPNRGSTASGLYPEIQFKGTTTSTPIKLKVDDDGSVIFSGTYGVLFNVSDSKDGLLHSVNDVSGLPIFEVYSYDYVKMGKWNQNALIVNSDKVGVGLTSPSVKFHISSTSSGAFRLVDTTQASGYVLTSDANGVGTWQPASGGGLSGSGTASYMTRWETNTQVGTSNIWHSPGGTAIGIGTSSHTGQLYLQFNSNYNDGIAVRNLSTGINALTTTGYVSADGAGSLQIGIVGDSNTANSGLGSPRDTFIRQTGPTATGGMIIGKQGTFVALNTASYSIRFTHGAASGPTFSSMLNMTKATFSATYYHFGFGPGAANYGQPGYISFGTGSQVARFRHGEVSISSTKASPGGQNYGSAISSIMTGVANTTSATAVDVYLDSITGVEKIWIPDRSVVGYRIDIIGTDNASPASRSIHTTHVGTIRRPSSTSLVVLDNDTYTLINDGFGGAQSQVQADTTNNTLRIRVAGIAATDIRWVARIDLVQVIITG